MERGGGAMTFVQAIFFAVVQGISELFPISSLGHAVVLPALLGWQIDQNSPAFLPFLVILHVGTASALLLYFWREWWGLLLALFGRGEHVDERRHLIALLVIGTLPAVVLGFIFEHRLRHLFGSPNAAALFLIINGFVLFAGERLRRRALRAGDRRELGEASWRDALTVGLWQTTAFLLATPVIGGAAVLEIPKLHHLPAGAAAVGSGTLWLAGLVAGVTAYASTAFLLRYFRSHEENPALDPFAYYCWAAGILSLVLLRFV